MNIIRLKANVKMNVHVVYGLVGVFIKAVSPQVI
jgi:hypothetical protein